MKPPAGEGRTTDDMSEDIDPAQPLERFPGQRRAAVRRGQVRLDVVDAIDPILDGPRGRDDPCAAGQEALDGRAAEALGSPADKHTLAGEFRGIDRDAHTVISKVSMAPFVSWKR